MATTIYALCHPHSGEVRYIGKTTMSVRARLNSHVCRAAKGKRNHRDCWIRSLPDRPVIRPMFVVADNFGSDMEIRAIAVFRARGYDLTNATIGGDGPTGYVQTPEERAHHSAVLKGRRLTPEHCARISAAKKGKPRPEWVREKLRGKERTPETCAILSANAKARVASGNFHLNTPEARAKALIGLRLAGLRRRKERV